jgi:helix-turn-helix protein
VAGAKRAAPARGKRDLTSGRRGRSQLWLLLLRAALLAQTELPVKEVARRVGYRDNSQFSKAFERTYGRLVDRAPSVAALELTLEAATALPERPRPPRLTPLCPQPRS